MGQSKDPSLFSLYDKSTIDTLPWPKTEQGVLAQQYLKPIIQEGSGKYFNNVSTTLQALLIDDLIFPITKNDRVEKNAYVCSTYTQYVNYALEEIEGLDNPLAKRILKGLVYCLGGLLKQGEIDKTVFVNNWLLPTNLYPPLTFNQVERLSKGLIQTFPEHAIAFRSVNTVACPELFEALKRLGYDLILCRDIYYTEGKEEDPLPFKARMVKSDFKLLETTPYRILKDEEINEKDSKQIAELYRMLNIDKHSSWNPCYTTHWVELIRRIPSFTLQAFENNSEVHGAFAYYGLNGVITSPFFGYDTGLPQEIGLYRQISALLLKEAYKQKKLLHQSSGAGHFKMLRRAKQEFEYTAVYSKHLSLKRRIPWKLLYQAMGVIGKAYLSARV